MNRLKKKYIKEVIPKLRKQFGYQNDLAVPKVEKAVVNVGTSRALKEPKVLDIMKKNLVEITGQKPFVRRARHSISGFDVKQGMVVGLKVTLRGKRMYDFLDKLINVALPRVRDFRGLKLAAVDRQGNLSIGLKEIIVFPEIDPNKVETIHGLEVCVTTDAETQKEGFALLRLLGFPFREK